MAMHHAFELLYNNFLDLGGFAPIFVFTEIACAIICLGENGCSSFFYHADEMNCVPSLTRYFNTTLLDYKDGYKYYIIRPDCKQGWELFDGKCYYFENGTMRFVNAESNCIQKGGYLAQTDSDAERDIFISLSQRGSFWLGGKKVNGNWTWSDGSLIATHYWANGQPSGGPTCAQQWRGQDGLDDESCGVFKKSLCEK